MMLCIPVIHACGTDRSDNIRSFTEVNPHFSSTKTWGHALKSETVYLSAYCSITDEHRFRQQGNRQRQQTSMLLLWWTASTVRFSMSMCSVCDVATASATGVCRKKKRESEKERTRGREKERMSNELRWVRHLHSLPVLFWREWGREGRRGGRKGGVGGLWGVGSKKTSARWRPFWRLQRSCTLEKGWGALNGAEEHRQNLGRKKACHTMAPGPMLGSKSQSETQREEDRKRQNGSDGPAGKYSSRSSRGRDGYICWAKGHRVFSAIHLKTNCAAQAGAVKPHLGVEWILFWPSKRKKKKKKKGSWDWRGGPGQKAGGGRGVAGGKRGGGGEIGGRWVNEQKQMRIVGGKGSETEKWECTIDDVIPFK